MLPALLFEDDDLLVVNKPAGLNTHAPAPFSGEGLYEWLRHREPRWADLAIIHRLDKETSGVLVFSKSPRANRSLTDQFTRHTLRKQYLFLTNRAGPAGERVVRSALVRAGEKYLARPAHAEADLAETRFRMAPATQSASVPRPAGFPEANLVLAEPLTGRTHQIRVHAAEAGFPVLGDVLYGGTAAARVFLHAAALTLRHPVSGEELTFAAPPGFGADARLALRAALVDPEETNACRLLHGAADGWPGWYVDRYGDYLLSQGEAALNDEQARALRDLERHFATRGAGHKTLLRRVRGETSSASPRALPGGGPLPATAVIRENGLAFEIRFDEGYSVGLFLDQRDNRRRLLTGHVAAGFDLVRTAPGRPLRVLNTFAYTCGFSVCAAKAGAETTSLDLSRKYLDWGKVNFAANGLALAGHDFIYGDVFAWLRRLARRERRFDVVLLDPPTFSSSKDSGVFRVDRDYPRLLAAALSVLAPEGVLFASANAAGWPPAEFLAGIEAAVRGARRAIRQSHYAPQPPDFPVTRAQPAYLKTAWFRVA